MSNWEELFQSNDRALAEHIRPTARMFAAMMAVFQDEGFTREEAHDWVTAIGQQVLNAQQQRG